MSNDPTQKSSSPQASADALAAAVEQQSEDEKAQQKEQELRAAVAESGKAAAEASAVHDAAKADLEAHLKAQEVVPEYGKHILVMLGGTADYVVREAPEGWNNDRTVVVDGQHCEHVDDRKFEAKKPAVWCYRQM